MICALQMFCLFLSNNIGCLWPWNTYRFIQVAECRPTCRSQVHAQDEKTKMNSNICVSNKSIHISQSLFLLHLEGKVGALGVGRTGYVRSMYAVNGLRFALQMLRNELLNKLE